MTMTSVNVLVIVISLGAAVFAWLQANTAKKQAQAAAEQVTIAQDHIEYVKKNYEQEENRLRDEIDNQHKAFFTIEKVVKGARQEVVISNIGNGEARITEILFDGADYTEHRSYESSNWRKGVIKGNGANLVITLIPSKFHRLNEIEVFWTDEVGEDSTHKLI
ncbi:hypothetical protein [Sinobaca sp. H24]|uniref:hypothetical protein n=1 Tax=Sinobaca sp. H24 TaxID=2923376 RepID=UPI00207959D8|nr:hypothetical protein [Sinobaca sp. H24]